MLPVQRSLPVCIFLCRIEAAGVSKLSARPVRLAAIAIFVQISHGVGRTMRIAVLFGGARTCASGEQYVLEWV